VGQRNVRQERRGPARTLWRPEPGSPAVASPLVSEPADSVVPPAEAVLAALGAAVRAVTAGSSLDRVLAQLATSARDLAGARYAAIGLPEPEGDEFAKFVTVGMSDELIERIGPLPRTHGLLAAMLGSPEPYRTPDISADPRFGWWPSAHPRMGSFLGVPIVSGDDIVGAFYLADKEPAGPGGPSFTGADEAAVVLLATYAAIAIDHARLVEDSRELALVAERARLARELHDAMSQSLFGLRLAAEAADQRLPQDPERAAEELATVRELAGRIGSDLREVVEGLRPADLDRDGLVAVLRNQLAVSGRAHGVEVALDAEMAVGLEPEAEHQVLRVVQEAVANALRHAKPSCVTVTLAEGERCTIVRVTDDGVGFDPEARLHRARRLGLTSMQERAEALGGTLTIESTPGTGTTVELRVPR
jgi:signal transduction histidine kinase